ncbi:MAG: 16S rRNA (adenine(1518)-N(6)/adenine(1519)-N(6))-dimethyltransferase RsmA [Vicinamibacterales bacterium]
MRKRFGQHFLEPVWADKVVEAIAPAPGDRFLEIGPGAGVLTSRLAPRVASLVAVEIDRDLAADLARHAPPNADIVTADFLELDLSRFLNGPLRVAGNLPYNISSPILFKLLGASTRSANLVDATLMLQREVADRLVALAGSHEYGVLGILTAIQADVRRLIDLPPGAFRPAPKVRSAVVRLTFRTPVVGGATRTELERMVRVMFTQRRKTLVNALRPFADARGRTSISAVSAAGLNPGRRPETLTLKELVLLASVFADQG